MAGKYSKLSLPAFALEPSYQEKLDELRKRFLPRLRNPDGGYGRVMTEHEHAGYVLQQCSLGELGALYKVEDAEADQLEAQLKVVKLRREAIAQEMVALMEDDDTSSVKLSDGTLFYTQLEPYASIKDRAAFMAWVKRKKLTGMLSMAWMSMNSIVKEALLEGKPLPDGVEAFMKTSIRTRKG